MSEHTKIPPQAIEIEQLLLGELIQFPQVIDDIISIISVEDFYKPSHQVIFQHIYDLWSESKKIDLQIVTNRLKGAGKLGDVGGVLFVTKLIDNVLHQANAKDHAYIIKEKSVQRQFVQFGASLENMAYESDIEELLTASNSQLDKITDGIFKVGDVVSYKQIIDNTIANYYERKENAKKGMVSGVHTPVFDLNKLTGGWQCGDLVIIAGRPSMGKTAMAVQCAVTAARIGMAVDIYTLEMTSIQFAQRIMACIEDIDIEKFRNGTLDADQEKLMENCVNKMLKLRLNIDDRSGITAEYVKAKSNSSKRKGNCDMIIVDYLQLMAFDGKLNTNEGLGSITRKLKALAKELNIPILLLSQLSRAVELRHNKRPIMADLRSSGEIEQDADLVIFPYREHYYSGKDEDEGIMELIVAKHRNGRTGTIQAAYNETITRIYDNFEKDEKQPDLPF